MAISPADIIVELEHAIAGRSSERCARMLWRTIDLLIAGRGHFREREIGVVDDVLLRLTERVEPKTLVQFASTLAEFTTAPRETLRRLVYHEDPAVAAPLLRKSPALSQADLEAVATSYGESHLLAIADRLRINANLAEILAKRGSKAVCLALIKNSGAQISGAVYSLLIHKAQTDREITKALALRPGVPDMVVRKLLCAAPQWAPPAHKAQPSLTEYANAKPKIVALNRAGKLNDSTVNRFAIRGEAANLFTALSVLSGAPIEIIEHVMVDIDCESLVMACRASRLNWATTLTILSNRGGARLSFEERERAQQLFESLYLSTSQWSVRWGEMAASNKPATFDGVARSGASG